MTRTSSFVFALLGCLLLGALAQARAPKFSLGEVSVPPRTASATKQHLSNVLSTELARGGEAIGAEAYVVNARLKQLQTERGGVARARCALSLVLTRGDTGAIFAMADAKVTAEDVRADLAEKNAIQAATRTAMQRVVTTLRARTQLAAR